MDQSIITEATLEVPLVCHVCKGMLFPDTQFNYDMRLSNIPKMRYGCIHDHGIIINLHVEKTERDEVRLCKECGKSLPDGAPHNQLWHRDCYRAHLKKVEPAPRGRRFKSGFYDG